MGHFNTNLQRAGTPALTASPSVPNILCSRGLGQSTTSIANRGPQRGVRPFLISANNKKRLRQFMETAAAVFLRSKKEFSASIAGGRETLCNPSRSPDLRILSRHTAFSGAFPMTDFHQCVEPPRLQWRYRSGFTPDFLFSAASWSDTATLLCCFVVMPSIRPSEWFVNSHYNEAFLNAPAISQKC